MKEKRQGNYYRVSQEDFIAKCKVSQKVPIDFTDFIYIDQKTKYNITCTKHNLNYSQQGQSLLIGTIGCSECLREHKSKITSSNLDEFVLKFKYKFPDSNFDFSKSVYTRARDHIEVVCNKGHNFRAKPNNLLSGHGCPVCFESSRGHAFARGKESYIRKFLEVHLDKYDYSLVEDFKNCKQKVTVICKTHGCFKITPDNHVQGKGCPLCGKAGYQPQKPATFYILKVTEDVIKFGITNNLTRRLKEINKASVFNIQVMYSFDFLDGYIPQEIENSVYRDTSILRSVVSKADMQSGYVETTYLSNLSKILSIVEKYKPD